MQCKAFSGNDLCHFPPMRGEEIGSNDEDRRPCVCMGAAHPQRRRPGSAGPPACFLTRFSFMGDGLERAGRVTEPVLIMRVTPKSPGRTSEGKVSGALHWPTPQRPPRTGGRPSFITFCRPLSFVAQDFQPESAKASSPTHCASAAPAADVGSTRLLRPTSHPNGPGQHPPAGSPRPIEGMSGNGHAR